MSKRVFETTIEDADRRIEFDVTVHWEQWEDYYRRTCVAATHVKVTGGRVAFRGMVSAGSRNTVWCEIDADDLATICVQDFCRKYRHEIDDAVVAEHERIEDAGLCLV
ncbi:MAG: hypothetical protein EBR82_29900 [Caulobacteraceae bacterium]|nr:hypothetical protein [Caulobacteraceae bacterium]